MMVDYMFGAANWIEQASSQLYIEPPRFSQQFSEATLHHRQKPSGSFERFGTKEKMRGYFRENKCNALFIYLIILLENIVYYYILYDFFDDYVT